MSYVKRDGGFHGVNNICKTCTHSCKQWANVELCACPVFESVPQHHVEGQQSLAGQTNAASALRGSEGRFLAKNPSESNRGASVLAEPNVNAEPVNVGGK